MNKNTIWNLIKLIKESEQLKNNIICGPEKSRLTLLLPYIGSQSTSFEITIRRITEKTYHFLKPGVIFKYDSIFTSRGKYFTTDETLNYIKYWLK